MRRLNIVDIDEPLAKAAPMVKAAHDLNEDFHFSMFQFKASCIHTYMQGPNILKSISCVLIALMMLQHCTCKRTYGVVFLIEGRYIDRNALIMIHA